MFNGLPGDYMARMDSRFLHAVVYPAADRLAPLERELELQRPPHAGIGVRARLSRRLVTLGLRVRHAIGAAGAAGGALSQP